MMSASIKEFRGAVCVLLFVILDWVTNKVSFFLKSYDILVEFFAFIHSMPSANIS